MFIADHGGSQPQSGGSVTIPIRPPRPLPEMSSNRHRPAMAAHLHGPLTAADGCPQGIAGGFAPAACPEQMGKPSSRGR